MIGCVIVHTLVGTKFLPLKESSMRVHFFSKLFSTLKKDRHLKTDNSVYTVYKGFITQKQRKLLDVINKIKSVLLAPQLKRRKLKFERKEKIKTEVLQNLLFFCKTKNIKKSRPNCCQPQDC